MVQGNEEAVAGGCPRGGERGWDSVALEGSWQLSRGGRREVDGPSTWAGGGGTGGEGSLWESRLMAAVSQCWVLG